MKPGFSEWEVTGEAAPSEARRAKSGGGFFFLGGGGGGSQPPPPRESGECYELPSGVRGEAPATQWFFYILSALDGFSCKQNLLSRRIFIIIIYLFCTL